MTVLDETAVQISSLSLMVAYDRKVWIKSELTWFIEYECNNLKWSNMTFLHKPGHRCNGYRVQTRETESLIQKYMIQQH